MDEMVAVIAVTVDVFTVSLGEVGGGGREVTDDVGDSDSPSGRIQVLSRVL
jgi:hypothetical protein